MRWRIALLAAAVITIVAADPARGQETVAAARSGDRVEADEPTILDVYTIIDLEPAAPPELDFGPGLVVWENERFRLRFFPVMPPFPLTWNRREHVTPAPVVNSIVLAGARIPLPPGRLAPSEAERQFQEFLEEVEE